MIQQNSMQKFTKANSSGVIIKASNLHKTYLLGVEGVAALRGVTFEIHSGEFIIILGNSGGGKTTLLNILGTIDKPTKGTLVVCGEKIKSNTPDEILSGLRLNYLGFVFQTFNLISSLTAQENVELPMILKGSLSKQDVSRRAKELLESVGMGHRLTHYPNQLSGGEQQRVTIARSLANQPKILLLDEPTGDLDSKNTDNVLRILLDLNVKKGITLIMVTHDVNLKYFSHRVLRVLDGKIVKQEPIPQHIRQQSIKRLMNKMPEHFDDIGMNGNDQAKLLPEKQGSPISEKTTVVKKPQQYSAVGWLLEKKKREMIEKQVMHRMGSSN